MGEKIPEGMRLRPSCGHCQFWTGASCHRMPPYLSALSTGEAFARTDRQGIWPLTSANDWCGEFKRFARPAPSSTET